jgi:hypothetical protein
VEGAPLSTSGGASDEASGEAPGELSRNGASGAGVPSSTGESSEASMATPVSAGPEGPSEDGPSAAPLSASEVVASTPPPSEARRGDDELPPQATPGSATIRTRARTKARGRWEGTAMIRHYCPRTRQMSPRTAAGHAAHLRCRAVTGGLQVRFLYWSTRTNRNRRQQTQPTAPKEGRHAAR